MIDHRSSLHPFLPARATPPFARKAGHREDQQVSGPAVLLAMHDGHLLRTLAADLAAEGYQVVSTQDGEQVLVLTEHIAFSLVLLDLTLPQRDGLALCRILRSQRQTAHLPIMLLASCYDETDMIIGLEVGADEYVILPCHWKLLRARIRALLRRSSYAEQTSGEQDPDATTGDQNPSEQVLIRGDLCIHIPGHAVMMKGRPVELSARLFRLLVYFVQHQGQVLTRKQLMEQVQESKQSPVDARLMDVYIHWLREKLEEDPAHPQHIQTLRGIGYRFTI